MSEQQKKLYVGNGKRVQTKNGGTFRKATLMLSRIAESDIEEFIKQTKAGKQVLNVVSYDRAEADQYGNDVEILVDNWKPTGETNRSTGGGGFSRNRPLQSRTDGRIQEQPKDEEGEDLPF